MTNDQAMAELWFTVNGAGYYRMGNYQLPANAGRWSNALIKGEYRVVFEDGQWWASRRHFGKTGWRTSMGCATPMAAVALAELRDWGKS